MNINRNIIYRLYTRTMGYRWWVDNMLEKEWRKRAGIHSYEFTECYVPWINFQWYMLLKNIVKLLDMIGVIHVKVNTVKKEG